MSKKYFFTDDNGDRYPEWNMTSIAELFEGKNSNLVVSTLSKSAKSANSENTYKVYGASGIAGYMNSFQQEDKYISVIKDGAGVGRLTLCEARTSIVGTMTALLPKKTCHLEFGFYLLQNNNLASDVSGSTIPHIYFKDYSKKKVDAPSLPEQKKIAEFFSALDERIALTADKVKLLKEQKTGYLQRIFSQEMVFTDENGDRYPEWEQKKLGEVADFINGFAFKPEHLGSEGTTVVKIKELLDPSDLSVKTTVDVPKSLHLINGDIIFSWSMTLACRIWNAGPAFLNQHLYKVIVKENCDSEFLNHLLNNELSKLKNLMHGGTAKHITRKDLLPYKVMMPSLPEQEKIAEFFSAFDERIELTENKLTLLKEQKKGYLQGIFGR